MNFIKKNLGNLLIVAVLIFVLNEQVPLWMHSNKQLGKRFEEISAFDLEGQPIKLPVGNKKKVYIFWATWCGPCHVQLAQFESAVASGSLPKDQIVGVSLDKSLNDLITFQKDKEYSFKIVQASPKQKWSDLNVQATPSIAFVDENKTVQNFFTGVSPLSVMKAKNFIK